MIGNLLSDDVVIDSWQNVLIIFSLSVLKKKLLCSLDRRCHRCAKTLMQPITQKVLKVSTPGVLAHHDKM